MICVTDLLPVRYSYTSPNKGSIPPGALRYLLSNENATSQIDDDGFEIGVNGTVGGFSSIYITKENMTVRYHDQNGTVLYSSWVPPRDLTSGGDDGKDGLDPEYVIIISVSVVAGTIIIGLAVYYLFVKKRLRRMSRGSSMAPAGVDELKQSSHAGNPLLNDAAGI
jgi:hypothetical protein